MAAGDNGKQYRAVFSIGVGSDATTTVATLTVNYAPSITTQPTDQTINNGATATFTAAATSKPAPTVQWQVNTPYYPQSNGKIERWHRSMKSECIRPEVPLSLDHARRMMDTYVTCCNDVRLHCAIGYVSPSWKLEWRDEAIWAQRRQNLAEANRKRNLANQSEVNAENEVVESKSLSVATAG